MRQFPPEAQEVATQFLALFFGVLTCVFCCFADDNGGARKRRITSAQIWALKGGCTGAEAMKMMREKHLERSKDAKDKEERAVVRQAEKDKVDDESKRIALPIIEELEDGKTTIDALTKPKLCSLLIFFDKVPVGMRQKKVADLKALVSAIPRLMVLTAPIAEPADDPPPPPPAASAAAAPAAAAAAPTASVVAP